MPVFEAVMDRRGHELMPAYRTNNAGLFISLGMGIAVPMTFLYNTLPKPFPEDNPFSHFTFDDVDNKTMYSAMLSEYEKFRPDISVEQAAFELKALVSGGLTFSILLFMAGTALFVFGKHKPVDGHE